VYGDVGFQRKSHKSLTSPETRLLAFADHEEGYLAGFPVFIFVLSIKRLTMLVGAAGCQRSEGTLRDYSPQGSSSLVEVQ
jgi:hypothetical protein